MQCVLDVIECLCVMCAGCDRVPVCNVYRCINVCLHVCDVCLHVCDVCLCDVRVPCVMCTCVMYVCWM